jgi:hypothetical protein
MSQGARVSRNYKRSETVDIQVKDDLEKIRTPGRVGGVILRGETAPPRHHSPAAIRPDSPCHHPMEHGRPPPLDSAALPPELHSTQIAARLPESVSRVVIDDNDLFLAPGLAKRRADSRADPLVGVGSGNQD